MLQPIRARYSYGRELTQWVTPWDMSREDFALSLVAALLGFYWSSTETARWLRSRLAGGRRFRRFEWQLPFVITSVILGAILLLMTVGDTYLQPFWNGAGIALLISGGASFLWTYNNHLSRLMLSTETVRPISTRWISTGLTSLGVLTMLVLAIRTNYYTYFLGLGTFFAQESVRSANALVSDESTKYIMELSDLTVRLGSAIPVAVLLFLGTGPTGFNQGYIAMCLLLVGNVLRSDIPLKGRYTIPSAATVVVNGMRVAVTALIIADVIALVVFSANQYRLSLVYLGLALLLLRSATELTQGVMKSTS